MIPEFNFVFIRQVNVYFPWTWQGVDCFLFFVFSEFCSFFVQLCAYYAYRIDLFESTFCFILSLFSFLWL